MKGMTICPNTSGVNYHSWQDFITEVIQFNQESTSENADLYAGN